MRYRCNICGEGLRAESVVTHDRIHAEVQSTLADALLEGASVLSARSEFEASYAMRDLVDKLRTPGSAEKGDAVLQAEKQIAGFFSTKLDSRLAVALAEVGRITQYQGDLANLPGHIESLMIELRELRGLAQSVMDEEENDSEQGLVRGYDDAQNGVANFPGSEQVPEPRTSFDG